jgi:antitoxin component YwqK of YwqJK toxin-antitoxin module
MIPFHRKKFAISIFFLSGFILFSCTKTEKTFWENGKPKSVLSKKGKHYDGKSTWYYSDGIKQHECNYVNDTLQGNSTRWYNNGRISSVDNYKDNQRHGKSLGYDYEGKLISEANYILDTLDGTFKEYYSTGQTKVEGTFRKGRFDGKWLYYHQDGTIAGIGEYVNGTGKQRAWCPNGKLKRIVQYQDNEKHGNEIWYDPEGKIEKTLIYEHDQLINEGTQPE